MAFLITFRNDQGQMLIISRAASQADAMKKAWFKLYDIYGIREKTSDLVEKEKIQTMDVEGLKDHRLYGSRSPVNRKQLSSDTSSLSLYIHSMYEVKEISPAEYTTLSKLQKNLLITEA